MSSATTRKTVRPELAGQIENFSRCFALTPAQTPEQKLSVFRLRYNVYCRNFGFEDPRMHAQGYETDGFDERSLHFLVVHRATGIPAGCVRLVMGDADDRLPLERNGAVVLYSQLARGQEIRRERSAEISRLAVDSPFCRLRGEPAPCSGALDRPSFDEQEQQAFPLISVSLILAACAAAGLVDRPNCFALMEPFLQVMCRRLGLPLQRAGADIQYRGKRAPFYCSIGEIERALPIELRNFYDQLRDELARSRSPGPVSALPGNEALHLARSVPVSDFRQTRSAPR